MGDLFIITGSSRSVRERRKMKKRYRYRVVFDITHFARGGKNAVDEIGKEV